MAVRYQRVRGMHDILPGVTERWREVEGILVDVLGRYGFQEIRLPLVEATELFTRGVGEATDLVEKEMYTFDDRKGKSLSLRPEGTAGCVRACIEHGLLHNRTQRLWYHGPMFRYERPQQGRTRQHTQIGAEMFGVSSPEVDAELLTMLARIFRELGVEAAVTLELNSLGSGSRDRYRQALVDYLAPYRDDLDADSRRRLAANPLRILDSKAPSTRTIIADAPSPVDYLDSTSRQHFDRLRRLLDRAGVGFRENPHLVRGLDYYTDTVFEWVTEALGTQGAVCAGGRYDNLVELLGYRPVPGAGFGMGLERVVLLHEACMQRGYRQTDVYLAVAVPDHAARAAAIAETLRDATSLRVLQHAGSGGLSSQLRQADRSGARWAVIVGDDEVAENRVSLKRLREESEQTMLDMAELIATLKDAG